MSIVLVTAAAELPVTLEEFKDHLRVDGTNEDTIITAFLTAAVNEVQELQWRQLVNAEYELRLDSFGGANGVIQLPKPPLQSITNVKYIDVDGAEQTVTASEYTNTVTSDNDYGCVYPAFNCTWPTPRKETHAVRITFTGGYGTRADVPEETKAAIKLLGATFYENRENVSVGQILSSLPNNMGIFSLINIHSLRKM